MVKVVSLIILCYLIGSIPFSFIFSNLFGHVDIRSKGSGNVGATNVLRTVGIKVAILSFLGDLLKGALAAFIGLHFGGEGLAALCSIAAVLGHCFPVFLKFKGGKGVSTCGGTILYTMPKVFLLLVIVLILTIVIFRYVSLGSIVVAALFPIAAFGFAYSWNYVFMGLVMAILVICRHKDNIDRLRIGTERKFNQKT